MIDMLGWIFRENITMQFSYWAVKPYHLPLAPGASAYPHMVEPKGMKRPFKHTLPENSPVLK